MPNPMLRIADPGFDHDCPLCGALISDVYITGSWSGAGGGFWLGSKCADCDIDFGLTLSHRNDAPLVWRMAGPPPSALIEPISLEDRRRLDTKLLRYAALGEKWRAFTDRCRSSDQLWRYTRNDGQTGIAVVRNGTPIAEFSVFGSL
jgi:hypothetical protein